MVLVHTHTKLCEVLNASPEIIPLINRLGISLGTGDKDIETICKDCHLDADFLVAIINTYINEDYFPENILKKFCVSTIVSYMCKTYAYYEHFQLANIERHFNALINRSGGNNNLGLMMLFFEELKKDVLNRIADDMKRWFPKIEALQQKQCDISSYAPDVDTTIIDKINDLKNLFIIHLNGSYDQNLCYGVIMSIISLEKDIRQNDRIRNRILLPLYDSLKRPNNS